VLFREITIVKERSIDDLLHELGEWADEDGDMSNAIDEAQGNVANHVCVVIDRDPPISIYSRCNHDPRVDHETI
jgi:cytidylate kinase